MKKTILIPLALIVGSCQEEKISAMRTGGPRYRSSVLLSLTTTCVLISAIGFVIPCSVLADADTLQILDSQGAPGDTVSVPIWMVNTFPVASARWMITYDPSVFRAFRVDGVFPLWGICTVGIDTLAGHVHWWGSANDGVIQPGSRKILYLVLNVRINAQPNTQVAIDFESSYLADSLTGGVVPVMVNGVFTITRVGIQEHFMSLVRAQTVNITPNPIESWARIEYYLPREAYVTLSVYDASGRLVKTLEKQRNSPGKSTVIWDATDNSGRRVPSGPYFLRLEAGEHTATRKLSVIR